MNIPLLPSSLDHEVQLKTIRDLDEGVNGHLRWLNHYNRALVCDADLDPSLTAGDAHRYCQFGRWYYGLDPSRYQPWLSQLKQISAIHEQMHCRASKLMQNRKAGLVDTVDYDHFTDTAYRFKTAVRALQFKLMREVCLVDHLTGAWNRNSLHQRLAAEYDRMLRHADPCCVCMMDLDHFKAINDKYGHTVGDQVLQEVILIAKQRLRRYDSIFRYGGEEFLFCLPKASLREAEAAMERTREDIAEKPIKLQGGLEISITASFGIVELSTVLSAEESIAVADHALFSAKAAGRNKVCCSAAV